MEYPKMLYKAGGVHEIHGGKFDHVIVDGAVEQEMAIANGYFLTTDEAAKAVKPTSTEDKKPGSWGKK